MRHDDRQPWRMIGLAEASAAFVDAERKAPSNQRQYEAYFSTGSYDRRYPCPNLRMLRLARRLLPHGGHLVDFGCGTGRYLLNLRERAGIAAGFDISVAALDRLAASLAARPHRTPVSLLGPGMRDLQRHVAANGPADLILCLFGVLSHIEGRAARREILRELSSLLAPGTGRLLVSVPNRRRRFVREQRVAGPGAEEIRYTRMLAEGSVEMSYRLFDPESLADELTGAGLAIEAMGAESLFSESVIARSPILRAADGLVAPILPGRMGYGITAIARPAGTGANG